MSKHLVQTPVQLYGERAEKGKAILGSAVEHQKSRRSTRKANFPQTVTKLDFHTSNNKQKLLAVLLDQISCCFQKKLNPNNGTVTMMIAVV